MKGAKQKNPSITAFFPCYNDGESIAKMVDDVSQTLNEIAQDFEIIVIDDYSSDNSREVLNSLAKKNKHLKLVFHKQNKGYGGALKTGFKAASKDLVFYTDGDAQYDPKELSLLLSLMTDDVNFINGIKIGRGDTQDRVFFGNLHKFITRWLFWLPIYDTDCDFRLIRKPLLDKLSLTSNSGSICVELVKRAERAGAVFRQVSVHHYERPYGQSQFFRIDRIFKTYWDMAKLWINLMILKG